MFFCDIKIYSKKRLYNRVELKKKEKEFPTPVFFLCGFKGYSLREDTLALRPKSKLFHLRAEYANPIPRIARRVLDIGFLSTACKQKTTLLGGFLCGGEKGIRTLDTG